MAGVAEVVSRTLSAEARRDTRGAARAAAASTAPLPASSRQHCDLFVALCRARGIPARFVEGFCDDAVGPQHYWVEVLLPRRGWRIVDPWLAARGTAVLGETSDLRLPLSFRTHDEALGGYHLCFLHASRDGQLAGWRDFKWHYTLLGRR
ncbi:MAG: transglutaminase-like domain-containing protein [Planctomycetota bacterium]